MTDHARTVLLKPGDTLLIGNTGDLDDETLAELPAVLASLRHALALANVTVFEQDIEVAAVTPVQPAADAVVLRLFDRIAVAQHRAVLAAWLTANRIDPATVADTWLSIEQTAGLRLIRYEAYRRDDAGCKLIDPRDPDRAWTVERVSPLVIDLNLPASAPDTQRDGDRVHPGG